MGNIHVLSVHFYVLAVRKSGVRCREQIVVQDSEFCNRFVFRKMEIGKRLKEERERLGYTQADFAALAESSKASQSSWESGGAFPNAKYLAAIAKVGADVNYILTGVRTIRPAEPVEPPPALPEPEPESEIQETGTEFNGLSPRKQALMQLIEALDDAETDDIRDAATKIKQAREERQLPREGLRKAS